MKTITLSAETGVLYRALEFITEAARECVCEEKLRRLELAAEEIFVNIASYAYGGGSGAVELDCGVRENLFFVRFRDRGTPYDPLRRPDPDLDLSAEERPVGGLGVYLAKLCVDEASYEYRNGQNVLTLGMKLQGGEA